MPQFSICLLTHNNGGFIRQALESILAQTCADWECLISDDASVDGTSDLIKGYTSDPRIRYSYHPTNLRQGQNWGYAIQHTSAPFVATLHADDVWQPTTLADYLEAMTQPGEADMVWGRWLRTNGELTTLVHQPPSSDDRVLSRDEAVRYLFRTNQCLPSVLCFHRRLVQETGFPNPHYGMLCDRDYTLRLSKSARTCRSLSKVLARYRVHAMSVTEEYLRTGKILEELDDFRTRLPALLAGVSEEFNMIREYDVNIAEFYFRSAMSLKLTGRECEAQRRLQQALKLDGSLARRPRFFLKLLLFRCGHLGRVLLRRVHGTNRWVNDAVA